MKMYGLRLVADKTKVAHYAVVEDENEASNVRLNLHFSERINWCDPSLWLVIDEEIAEKAKTGTPWYDSSYNNPAHNKNPDELEIYVNQQ